MSSSVPKPVICKPTCPLYSPSPCPCASNNKEPVRHNNGEAQQFITDLASTGFGGNFSHARGYCNQLWQGDERVNADFGNGYNWLLSGLPHLVRDEDEAGDFIAAIFDSQEAYWFDEFENNETYYYAARYGAYQTLTHDEENHILTLTYPDGRKWKFHDFEQENYPEGALKQFSSPGGQTVTPSYDGNDRLTRLQRSGDGTTELLLYAYDANDHIQSVTLTRGGTNIQRVVYGYYTSDETGKGSVGDLKTVTRQDYDGGWVTLDVQYYRYYTESENLDLIHCLKYVLGPRAYQRMVDDDYTPTSATNAQVAQYADNYYTYNAANKRVISEQVAGGTRTYYFNYSTQEPVNTDYNNWRTRTYESRPDGSVMIVFTNHIGQPLLRQLSSGSKSWTEYFKYDIDAHLIEHWTPAAVDTYTYTGGENNDKLVITADEDGLIHVTDYYGENPSPAAGSSTAGGVEGYVQYQKIKQGNSGTEIKISETKYFSRTVSGATIYPVAEQIVYQSESGTGNPATTSYGYQWSTFQITQRTTTLPIVSTAHNGPGGESGATRGEVFDAYGNLTSFTDERGKITAHTYDVATAVCTQTTQDSGGLGLVSNFQGDSRSRVTQSLGPAHNINGASVRSAVWTVYDDANHQVRSARGYATGTSPNYSYTLVNPVSIVKLDHGGRTLESIQATRASTSGKLLASDAFAQTSYVRWTTNQYNNIGQLDWTRVYHNIPTSGAGASGTNYAQTSFDYDSMGRQNKLTAPGGTITGTTFDCRNNPTAVYVGTSGNMVQVTAYDYEGSGGDCSCSGGLTGGLLSTLTQYTGTGANRVSEYQYDWRNRPEYAIDPADADDRVTYAKNYFDNLGRAWKVERYYDADADGTFPTDGTVDDGDRLIARGRTYYDDLGRAYKTETYAVDPDDGTVGNALTSNIWYDAAGNVIKQKPAGSDSFTKTSYDGVGRPIKQYVGYDTDETLYADADDVDGDTIFEQTETTYDPQGNQTWIVSRSRFHDATGTGELTTPGGSQPKARVSYMGTWYDQIRRQTATANYGTNGGSVPTRPNSAPASSDTVLVSTVEYDTSTGDDYKTVDPKGREDRTEFDDAGRVTKTTQNYTDGNPATGNPDEDVTVERTYTIDGEVSTLTAKNSTTNDQVTQYIYGTAVGGGFTPLIYRNDLLRAVIYPDSDDPTTLDGNGTDGVYDRVEHKYNRQSELIETKDQNGTVHEFEYDKLGRKTADKATTLGTDVDNAVRRIKRDYEVRGMVERVTHYDAASGGYAVGEVELSYDDFGQPIADHQEHDGEVGEETPKVQYAYADGTDNHVRLVSITYPNDRVLHHEYSSGNDNNLSRVSYLSDVDANGTRLAEYTYLGHGQIVKVDYPQPDLRYNLAHGVGDDPYDGLDRFGRVVDLLWYDYGSSADAVRIKHGYDRASNRLWREDTVSKSQGTPVYIDELYTYDGMYQLATLQRGQLNGTKDGLENGTKNFAEQWTLDPTGNWTNFKQDTDGDDDWDVDQDRDHNEANEIEEIDESSTHVAHDVAGNMIRAPKPDDWDDHYHLVYDAWNRLVTVYDSDGETLVAGYNYDGLGRRVVKETYVEGSLSEMRHYYYSRQWQVLEERVQSNYYSSSSGSLSATQLNSQYVWGLRYVDDLVLRDDDTDSDGTLDRRLYALQDPNWNVVAIADTSGDVQERYRYDAYGKPTFLSGTFGDPSTTSSYSWNVLYTGREYDAGTGLYHYRNRYYHPLLGRFITKDPIEYEGGINLYEYVGDSPLVFIDPFGEGKVRLIYKVGENIVKVCTVSYETAVKLLKNKVKKGKVKIFVQVKDDKTAKELAKAASPKSKAIKHGVGEKGHPGHYHSDIGKKGKAKQAAPHIGSEYTGSAGAVIVGAEVSKPEKDGSSLLADAAEEITELIIDLTPIGDIQTIITDGPELIEVIGDTAKIITELLQTLK